MKTVIIKEISIIGSIKLEWEMGQVKEYISETYSDIEVVQCPKKDLYCDAFGIIDKYVYNLIHNTDVVVCCTRNHHIGDGVAYEMAIAKALNKQIYMVDVDDFLKRHVLISKEEAFKILTDQAVKEFQDKLGMTMEELKEFDRILESYEEV